MFRLTKEDCQNIIAGNCDDVYEKELQLIYEQMSISEGNKLYRLQGEAQMLRKIMALYQRAEKQLV